MSDEFIERILSGHKSAAQKLHNPGAAADLEAKLEDVKSRLSNILKAIEVGIFNETTQERMEELTARRKELAKEIHDAGVPFETWLIDYRVRVLQDLLKEGTP